MNLIVEEVDIYEKLMPCLNEKRCDDFSSWFRLCGITYSMLRKYKADTSAQRRIWTAFFRWSAVGDEMLYTKCWVHHCSACVNSIFRQSRVRGGQLALMCMQYDWIDGVILC
eukprot:GHVQ01027535.1.p1 GENE.GHVQ01027535.1~~GHVQ01027535.1.p1  ORF type:complete len:112 (-),score=7.89 GHVQ01027535.1:765-1100(-)